MTDVVVTSDPESYFGQIDIDGAYVTNAGPDEWVITIPGVDQETANTAVENAKVSSVAITNSVEITLLATTALEINRNESAQNVAIITAANNMLAFAGTSLTQPQLIAALKDLATGVKLMAVHDQTNKAQLNHLIRLVIRKLDRTD
jgi:hypothetical protein